MLLDLRGSGIRRSAKFTASGDWKISYSYNSASFGYQGNFIITVYRGASEYVDSAANELGMKGSGSQPEYEPGRFYLEMNSECSWHVTAKG